MGVLLIRKNIFKKMVLQITLFSKIVSEDKYYIFSLYVGSM